MTALREGGGGGVAHGQALSDLADAIVSRDRHAIAAARGAVRTAMGDAAAVDAIAVAANFERMVRIADPTGIPLGDMLENASADVREALNMTAKAVE